MGLQSIMAFILVHPPPPSILHINFRFICHFLQKSFLHRNFPSFAKAFSYYYYFPFVGLSTLLQKSCTAARKSRNRILVFYIQCEIKEAEKGGLLVRKILGIYFCDWSYFTRKSDSVWKYIFNISILKNPRQKRHNHFIRFIF